MKVRFTTEAKADLQQIGDYIAKDNPSPVRCHSLMSWNRNA